MLTFTLKLKFQLRVIVVETLQEIIVYHMTWLASQTTALLLFHRSFIANVYPYLCL